MIRIVWVGFHEEGVEAFLSILDQGYKVDAFITLDEMAFARRSAGSREYEHICNEYDVPYYMFNTIKGNDAFQLIDSLAPDLLVVLGWSEILPEKLLQIPKIGTVGAHAALLPHNRGSAPINWAIIHGENKTGNTMMWLTPKVDAGEIIDQIAFDITPYDTCKTLYDKVAETNAIMLTRLLKKLENGIKPYSNIENITNEEILPRRRPQDGLIDWNSEGIAVYNFIRALTDPYPGAFTILNKQKWIIWKAILLPVKSVNEPGTIEGIAYGFCDNSCGYLVSTKDHSILVTEMESETGYRFRGKELNDLMLKGKMNDE